MDDPTPRSQLVLVLATVVSGVGLLDALVGPTWDFVAVFGLALLLQLLLLVRSATGRIPLTLRPDLARWVSNRAAATGETAEEVLDRCVAMAKAGLVEEEPR